MTLKQMIQNVYAILRKEERGGVFTPDDFNRYVAFFTREVYDEFKDEMEKNETITSHMERYVTSVIRAQKTPVADNAYNYNDKPDSFEKHLSALALYDNLYQRKVDLVTRMEYEERAGDILTAPSTRNPVIYYEDGVEYVHPNVGYKLTYMVSPATPFLDYYYDANRVIQYLEVGDTHTLATGEVYRDGTSSVGYAITNATVEIDMDEDGQKRVMNRILRLLGVTVPNEGVFAYGTQEKGSEQ